MQASLFDKYWKKVISINFSVPILSIQLKHQRKNRIHYNQNPFIFFLMIIHLFYLFTFILLRNHFLNIVVFFFGRKYPATSIRWIIIAEYFFSGANLNYEIYLAAETKKNSHCDIVLHTEFLKEFWTSLDFRILSVSHFFLFCWIWCVCMCNTVFSVYPRNIVFVFAVKQWRIAGFIGTESQERKAHMYGINYWNTFQKRSVSSDNVGLFQPTGGDSGNAVWVSNIEQTMFYC